MKAEYHVSCPCGHLWWSGEPNPARCPKCLKRLLWKRYGIKEPVR